jgi:hypothetical protein
MKQFFAFYNPGFDSELQAQTYADEAAVHAKAIGKVVDSAIVDVTGNDPAKKFWNTSNTITCVTVDNNALKESRLNPSALADIDAMIDRL